MKIYSDLLYYFVSREIGCYIVGIIVCRFVRPGFMIFTGFLECEKCVNDVDEMFFLMVICWYAEKWLEEMIMQSMMLWKLWLM